MKKSQKSKIVLCSILGLAAISIGSVGFATWLVGVNKTTETLTVQAVVDNSQNDSIYLDVVTTQEKVKVEGKKRPQLMDVDHTFQMDKVKYTKYLISFK